MEDIQASRCQVFISPSLPPLVTPVTSESSSRLGWHVAVYWRRDHFCSTVLFPYSGHGWTLAFGWVRYWSGVCGCREHEKITLVPEAELCPKVLFLWGSVSSRHLSAEFSVKGMADGFSQIRNRLSEHFAQVGLRGQMRTVGDSSTQFYSAEENCFITVLLVKGDVCYFLMLKCFTHIKVERQLSKVFVYWFSLGSVVLLKHWSVCLS